MLFVVNVVVVVGMAPVGYEVCRGKEVGTGPMYVAAVLGVGSERGRVNCSGWRRSIKRHYGKACVLSKRARCVEKGQLVGSLRASAGGSARAQGRRPIRSRSCRRSRHNANNNKHGRKARPCRWQVQKMDKKKKKEKEKEERHTCRREGKERPSPAARFDRAKATSKLGFSDAALRLDAPPGPAGATAARPN